MADVEEREAVRRLVSVEVERLVVVVVDIRDRRACRAPIGDDHVWPWVAGFIVDFSQPFVSCVYEYWSQ